MSNYLEFKFDKEITRAQPMLFNYIESKSFLVVVYYIIDWRYRKSVELTSWLTSQFDLVPPAMKDVADDIVKTNGALNYDYIMTDILRYVIDNFTYETDQDLWDVPELWEDIDKVWSNKKCDCESGALVIFLLARLCNIPDNRLLITCAWMQRDRLAKEEGHCFVGYRGEEYPLNWCFMDWCWLPNRLTPDSRDRYYIHDTTIYSPLPWTDYKRLMFAFNEEKAFRGLMNVDSA